MTMPCHLGRSILLAAAMLALSGCDGPAPYPPTTPALVTVPDTVQAMMAEDFPADGEIHTKSLGRITIEPDTPVCEIWKALPEDRRANHFGVNSSDLFPPLGQPTNRDGGSDRQVAANVVKCPASNSVVIHGLKLSNRNGKPYKLMLAVWQSDPAEGGAVWVGGVERIDGIHPQIAAMPEPEYEPREALKRGGSMILDSEALAQAFVTYLIGAESSGK
jgi:hypothetical protein